MARPNPNKFDYKWKVGDILRTTRDIDFGSDIVKKGTIVYIFRRFQGYNFVCLKPAFAQSKFRSTITGDFEEITVAQWISILNG